MKIALIWTGNQAPRVFSALQRGLAGAGGDSPTQTQQTQAEAKTQKHSTKPDAVKDRTPAETGASPAEKFFFVLARCRPSWLPSPEIRIALAKFTTFSARDKTSIAGAGMP